MSVRLRPARAGAAWFVALATGAALGPASAAPAADDPIQVLRAVEKAFVDVARRVSPCVVSISVRRKADAAADDWMDKIPDDEWHRYFSRPKEDFRRQEVASAGSGVILAADGYILTNAHVVEEAEEIQVRLSDGRPFEARLVQADQRSDLAVIRIPATGLTPATFNTTGRVEVGQWVIALGNPFGFGRDGRATLTHGVVSALGRNLPALGQEEDRYYGHLIQTDAPINPGNSGGALLNISGEVVGINTAIYSTGRGSQGIGFAIAIDERTMGVIGRLKRGEKIEYGYLGVEIRGVDESDAQRLGVPPRRGALVGGIQPGSPAALAGLKKDDVIVSFNGVPVANEDELIREVGATAVGRECPVELIRAGKSVTLRVTVARRDLSRRPATRPARSPTGPGGDPSRYAWRGITVGPLTKDLADRLGLEVGKGAVVVACEEGSPAHAAGLRPGFVIDQIGSRPITGPTDFRVVTSALPPSWTGLIHTNKGFYVIGPETK